MCGFLFLYSIHIDQVKSQAEILTNIIETQSAWDWARTPEFSGSLQEKLTKTMEALPELGQQILIQSDKELVSNYEASSLLPAAIQVPLAINAHVEDLQNTTKRLLRMQQQNFE